MKYFIMLLFFFSCAKDRPYEEVFKDKEVISKEMISSLDNPNALVGSTTYNKGSKDFETTIGDNVYLYIPTLEQGGYYNPKATSYFMGQEKLVTFKFTKDSLRVSSIEKDERFASEEVNGKPILEIPITHKDFRCRKNADDECSNKEEENQDISWDKKKFVEMDFSGVKVLETNALPIDLSNLFFPCYSEVDQKVHSWSITGDEVHIIVDKTFKTNILCSRIQTFEDLEKTTFSLRHHYQFKKLNSIADKDYKSIPYYGNDENKFGFFSTEVKKLSADNREVYYSRKTMMNRFNPSQKIIPYVVSENLLRSHNSDLLNATKEVFDIINDGLNEAKTGIQLSLKKVARESNLHKVQNSIILVEEPLAGGLLGYGPSVANPVTGEILQAQTVMYAGNHIKFIRRTYNELVSKYLSAKRIVNAKEITKEDAQAKSVEGMVEKTLDHEIFYPLKNHLYEQNIQFQKNLEINQFARAFDKQREDTYLSGAMREASLVERFEDQLITNDPTAILANHNMYHKSFMNLDDMMKKIIKDTGMNEEELKPWAGLSDSERETIIGVILPKVWKQVLLHEIGHNLGLRHNFGGSEDKENFYTLEELASKGIDQEIPYSTVMEYGYSDLNSLPILGKYDLAALKFGYARLVETTSGEEIKLHNSIAFLDPEVSQNLKAYRFCTDEHVYLNAMCNRFDEGTNINEVVDHLISNYYKSYKYTSTKQDRLRFSTYDNLSSMMGKFHRTFFPLRKFFDQYEMMRDYVVNGSIPADHPVIKENQLAVMKIANFMMSVLNEHDAHCKIIDLTTMRSLWVPLATLGHASCFSIGPIQGRYFPVGQTGKIQQDLKSVINPSSLVSEIDVRGAWVDKFLALYTLSMKEHGIKSLDEQTESFISLKIPYQTDGESVDVGVKKMMDSLIDGSIEKDVIVEYMGGEIKKERLRITSETSDFIKESESGVFNRVVGLNKSKTHLSKILLKVLIGNNSSLESALTKPIVKDYIATKKQSLGQQCVATSYGDVCFAQSSKKILEIIEKAKTSTELAGKNQEYLKVIAREVLADKTLLEISDELKEVQITGGKSLYEAYQVIFDSLEKISPLVAKDFLEGKTEEMSPEVLDTLNKLPTELIELRVSMKDEVTGLELATQYVIKVSGSAESYVPIIEKIMLVKNEGVLKSIQAGTLANSVHYEKILSAISL